MGTVVFRDEGDVPEELVFHINYLGGDMPNYSLNFSRPSDSVILQYYNFVRLGRAGYEALVKNVLANATELAKRLGSLEELEVLNDGTRFPIVAVRTREGEDLNLAAVSHRLRERGWIVPAYTLPPNAEHITVLRMVVKEDLSRDMVDVLVHDVRTAIAHEKSPAPHAARPRRRPLY
jgi:glutamate decarboxylase